MAKGLRGLAGARALIGGAIALGFAATNCRDFNDQSDTPSNATGATAGSGGTGGRAGEIGGNAGQPPAQHDTDGFAGGGSENRGDDAPTGGGLGGRPAGATRGGSGTGVTYGSSGATHRPPSAPDPQGDADGGASGAAGSRDENGGAPSAVVPSPFSRVRDIVDATGNTLQVRDCGALSDGQGHCSVLVPTNADGKPLAPTSKPEGWGPPDLAVAYGYSLAGGSLRAIAVVDAYDDPNVEADLAVYRARYGLPRCATDDGCFTKVNQRGEKVPLPAAAPSGANWATQTVLDVEMVSAACPYCDIVLVEADSASFADLATTAESAAASLANYVSNSWLFAEFAEEASIGEAAFDRSGVSIFAAAGDDGFGVGYPSSSAYVTSVGGTVLTLAPGTHRGFSERVWPETGSGCSAFIPKPSWQSDGECPRRTTNDVSAVAEGVAVYDSFTTGGWTTVHGTGIATPLVAAIYANTDSNGAGPALSYGHTSFEDVVSGADGSCAGSYLCTGSAHYDGPTGNGSPIASNLEREATLVGDVDGDGLADGFAVDASALYVTLSSGSGFDSPANWFDGPFFGTERTLLADVDGDGKSDVIAVNHDNVLTARSSGSGFESPTKWYDGAFYGTDGTFFGDVTGDHRADGIAFDAADIYVLPSTGSEFSAPVLWYTGQVHATITKQIADVNGDGLADIVAVSADDVDVLLSTGAGFTEPQRWYDGSVYGTVATFAADVDGDGMADLIAVDGSDVYVARSTGAEFSAPSMWVALPFYGVFTTRFADVDGDGRADGVAVDDGGIYVLRSTGSNFLGPELWLDGPFYGYD